MLAANDTQTTILLKLNAFEVSTALRRAQVHATLPIRGSDCRTAISLFGKEFRNKR
jgi:hypothetical protein